MSTLAVLSFWSGAGLLMLLGMFGLIVHKATVGDSLPMFLLASASMVGGLLMLPSAYYALWRILNRPAWDTQAVMRRLRLQWWLLALPVVVIFGSLLAQHPRIAWLGLPILHPLAIGIPTVWLLFIAVHGLPLGSSQRMWSVFGNGLTLGPLLIFILESLVGFTFLIALVAYLFTQPGLPEKIMQLSPLLEQGNAPEKLLEELKPILLRPGVMLGIFLFMAVAVPLIEELIKPVGVWLLFGRKLTPAAGFAAGALSGSGYALIESLALSSNGAEWSSLVLARTGTSAVHILTAGLTGWALALAWQKRRVFQLLLAYLCAVLIHGLWNGLTLMYSFNLLAALPGSSWVGRLVRAVGMSAPLSLVLLALGCVMVMAVANRSLRRFAAGKESSSAPFESPKEPQETML